MEEEMSIADLTNLLAENNIEIFVLDTGKHTVTLQYKEDFDALIPKLGVEPMMHDPNQYGAPFSFGVYAFFYYKGWDITGNIKNRKPSEK
jgi:hypothetical protein